MEKGLAAEGSSDRAERAAGADVSAAPADQPLEDKESSTVNASSASDGEGSHKSYNSGSVKDHGSDSIEGKKSKNDRIKGRDEILAECTYKDYSQVPPELSNDQELAAKKHLPAKEPTFPVKLHMILSNPSLESIISWLPHGRSWRILNQRDFEEKVIPLYFRHGRFSSFTRQVSGWGFHRITAGADFNSYYHELFLRGKPHLCQMMKRLTIKDTEKRRDFKKSCQVEPVPDFYLMDRTNPLPQNNPSDAPLFPGNALHQPIGLPGHNPAAIMQQNSVPPPQLPKPVNEFDPLRLLQSAFSGHINSSQAAVQQPPPPQQQQQQQQPTLTTSSTSPDVMGLLSLLLSSGQIQPQVIAAILMALTPQAAPAAPQQQPYMLPNPQQQLPFNFVSAAAPAPIYSTYQQAPVTHQAPVSVDPAQGNSYNSNSVNQLLSQLLQGQPQLAPQMPPPPQPFSNPLASLFLQVKPVQQPQQQQQQQPPPHQPQSRENNTTGQTIANFLLEQQQQQQAAATAAVAPPPAPTSSNPLADLLQQAQSQPNGLQDLAALLLSQQRNANGT